jgi:hypothetical protein
MMPKLPVTAFCPYVTPAVLFQKLDYFVDLHVVSARIATSDAFGDLWICG